MKGIAKQMDFDLWKFVRDHIYEADPSSSNCSGYVLAELVSVAPKVRTYAPKASSQVLQNLYKAA